MITVPVEISLVVWFKKIIEMNGRIIIDYDRYLTHIDT